MSGSPPLWLVQGALIAVLVLLVGFAVSRRPRVFHLLLLLPITGLSFLEGRGSGAFSDLALIAWWLMILAPYEGIRTPDGERRQGPITGRRLLALQWSSVYLITVAAKVLDGSGWENGRAIWRATHSSHTGQFLLSAWVDIPMWFCQVASWGTLCAELFVAIGMWSARTRLSAAVVCVMLHLGMALSLRITPLFHTLMLLHLVLFVSDRGWARIGLGATR